MLYAKVCATKIAGVLAISLCKKENQRYSILESHLIKRSSCRCRYTRVANVLNTPTKLQEKTIQSVKQASTQRFNNLPFATIAKINAVFVLWRIGIAMVFDFKDWQHAIVVLLFILPNLGLVI